MTTMAYSLLVALALFAFAVEAVAQYPGGGAGSPGGAGGPGGASQSRLPPPRNAPSDAPRRGPEVPLSPGALVQVDLDQIEDDLKLTPAQLPVWRSYADKVQKLADTTARSQFDARSSPPASVDAVRQLDQIAGGIRGRTTSIEEIVDAGRVLYATLTPEQKVIADRRLSQSVSLLATGITPPGMSEGTGRTARRSPP
jgi:hypothetical protein